MLEGEASGKWIEDIFISVSKIGKKEPVTKCRNRSEPVWEMGRGREYLLSICYVLNALHGLHHFNVVSNPVEWCCLPPFYG